MKISINDLVRIKITKKGINILKEQHDQLRRVVPTIGEFVYPEVDEEGYTKMQLWVVMESFGPYISFGAAEQPLGTEIVIQDK